MWMYERVKDAWAGMNVSPGMKALKWFIIGGLSAMVLGYFFG